MASNRDWGKDPLDIDWVIDSGLLFEVNRQFFHPLGVALSVKVDAAGNKTWGFKDSRADPGGLCFDPNAAEAGMKKWVRFLKTWGYAQMDRRLKKRGQTVQHVDKVDS